MTAYAACHLAASSGAPHPDVLTYIERIQGTMEPYGGRFLVHGTVPEVLEGSWPGFLILIGFPDLERARAWYASPAYQEILPLRSRHLDGDVILVDGVPEDYNAAHTAALMRAAS